MNGIPLLVARKRSGTHRDLDGIEAVGRVGTLQLAYSARDGRTILTRSHCTTPWHVLPPAYLDETGAAYTQLVNPSGGLVGGDRLSIELNLDKGTHVLISTPSANRVYRSEENPSEQIVRVTIGSGAILEWLPEQIIPFAGSRFRQIIRVQLGPGSAIMLWDAIAAGRIARGERWAFATLENDVHITTTSGGALLERYKLDPSTDLGQVGLAEAWNYVASLSVVGDSISPEIWNRLESKAVSLLDEWPGQVLGGVSTPAVPGLAVKLLAMAAPDLNRIFDTLWTALRRELWNLPAVSLRKY